MEARINWSPEIKELSMALLEFHKKVGAIKKTSTNPHFKSKYADISAIIEETEPILNECGLVITQWPVGNQLVTLLIHAASGQFITSESPLMMAQQTAQAKGSAITYERRYSQCAILNLNTEDDDGNKASEQPKPVVFTNDMNVEIAKATTIEELNVIYKKYPKFVEQKNQHFLNALGTRKKQILDEVAAQEPQTEGAGGLLD